jgi:type 1 glutamine amidotransferase
VAELLVVSGGHPFEAEAFEAMLAQLDGYRTTHLSHPEAERAIADGAADTADALLFYDMPGYTFADGAVEARPPSPGYIAALKGRFAQGRGAVMMHHALAGWSEWPEWSEIVGGRFLYQPGTVRGKPCQDSGYRHDVTYTARCVADHPVTAGVPASFELTDELYLAEVFEDEVVPLVRARHAFNRDNFYSAAHAIQGRMFDNAGWAHDDGSDLVAWYRHHERARIVYLQFGDGPAAYANPSVIRLLGNALSWTAKGEG